MADTQPAKTEGVELLDGISVIRPGLDNESWNGLSYKVGYPSARSARRTSR